MERISSGTRFHANRAGHSALHLCYFYGLARSTGDIDYWAAILPNLNLIEAAEEGSPLAKKHKVRLHHVAVNTMPEDYDMRLTEMAAGQFKHLKLFVPDAHDCILSKLERNQSKDRDDSDYLFRSNGLNGQELRARYEKEPIGFILRYNSRPCSV
jgi:Nucleotidyltransferase of unknown function (DUF6036)